MAKKPKEKEEPAAEDAGAEEAPAEGGGRKKLIVIAAAGLLALGAAGGGGWWWFSKKANAQAEAAQEMKKQVAFVEMRDMMVNLAQTQGVERPNFLKLKVALEVPDPKLVPEINPLLPRVEDAFNVYIRELRASELEGSAAMVRLKEELLKRVNIALYPAKIDAILFKEMLVQ